MVKTVNGVTTRYLVDDLNPTGYPQVVDELNGAGAVTRILCDRLRAAEIWAVGVPSFAGKKAKDGAPPSGVTPT